MVSEYMLQQTQAGRVVEAWRAFLEVFPTPAVLAEAPLSLVLRQWGTLGFPRRAKALHDAARIIRDDYSGEVPDDVASLRGLPGVGDYTANAIASFAFNRRVAVLDTNVGRVLARCVANRRLTKGEAVALAHDVLPRSNCASFNQAMLDLGAQYCTARPTCATCPMRRRCRWRVEGGEDPAPTSGGVSRAQTRFAGSDRQLRGRVLALLRDGARSRDEIHQRLDDVAGVRLDGVIAALCEDGLVSADHRVALAGD